MDWISVKTQLPEPPRGKHALGVAVLVWPNTCGSDGFCYYGKRATGRPEFYIYGAVVDGVTHWQPMPKGPKKSRIRSGTNDGH